MKRGLVCGLLFVLGCGSKPAVETPRPQVMYRSPVTGALIVETRYRRFAGWDSARIINTIRDERALYIPPNDPDARSLSDQEHPRILIAAPAASAVPRRILLHEYAHYLLLSARFPHAVTVRGKTVFGGKAERLETLALREQRANDRSQE
jgi:hypothetical protein